MTNAPGTGAKLSSGVGELYNCAEMVTVEPVRDTAAPMLKYAAREVITPSLGIENATLLSPVVSMIPPSRVAVSFEPKPMRD